MSIGTGKVVYGAKKEKTQRWNSQEKRKKEKKKLRNISHSQSEKL